jgi:hypothetical protein
MYYSQFDITRKVSYWLINNEWRQVFGSKHTLKSVATINKFFNRPRLNWRYIVLFKPPSRER